MTPARSMIGMVPLLPDQSDFQEDWLTQQWNDPGCASTERPSLYMTVMLYPRDMPPHYEKCVFINVSSISTNKTDMWSPLQTVPLLKT